MYRAIDDGITHVNTYSKGATQLGRLISNMYEDPFTCELGSFRCIECLYHYVRFYQEPEAEMFHSLNGFDGKKLANLLKAERKEDFYPGWEKILYTQMWEKFKRHRCYFVFQYKDLPLVHYYVYGGKEVQTGTISRWDEEVEKMRKCIYSLEEYHYGDE